MIRDSRFEIEGEVRCRWVFQSVTGRQRTVFLGVLCLISVLLLAVAGCPGPEAPAGLVLEHPDWAEQEVSGYLITSAEDTVGYRVIRILRKEYDGVPVLELAIETVTMVNDMPARDNALVVLLLDNLQPVRSDRRINYPDLRREISVRYSEDSIRTRVVSSEETTQLVFARKPGDYDQEQVTTLIRALPLSYGEQLRLNLIDGATGQRKSASVNLVGMETITVPAGTFDCRYVRLADGDRESDIWYETTGARRMVLYRAPAAGLEMKLESSEMSDGSERLMGQNDQ